MKVYAGLAVLFLIVVVALGGINLANAAADKPVHKRTAAAAQY